MLLFSVLTGRALINFFFTRAALNGKGKAIIWVRYITIGEAVKHHFPVVHCITLHSQGDYVSAINHSSESYREQYVSLTLYYDIKSRSNF